MVGVLDVDAELLEREDRLAAQVGAGVERGQVEIAALVEDLGDAGLGLLGAEVEVLELGTDVEVVEAHLVGPFERPAHDPARIALIGIAARDLDVAEHPRGALLLLGPPGDELQQVGSGIAIMSDSSIGLNP